MDIHLSRRTSHRFNNLSLDRRARCNSREISIPSTLSHGLRRFRVLRVRVRRQDRTHTPIRGRIERFRTIKGLGHHVCSPKARIIPEVRSPVRSRPILSSVRDGRAGSLTTDPCCCCPLFEIQQESVNISDFLFFSLSPLLRVAILLSLSIALLLFPCPIFSPLPPSSLDPLRSSVHLPIPPMLFPSLGLSAHLPAHICIS